ncbi:hypothetical protein [Pseudonocardia sp. MH-G8]|uniref:hypothetical protein n=1 Tax=Pseudonocardia sp. MH-G8 TaxID=1854588 RepID=UPI000BA018A4|nr:hypothetical protein [Pseudonocardia sp. MH-G8]OZM81718.1 transcriptional regulator [Pseudonocardia sp. MH-G8]
MEPNTKLRTLRESLASPTFFGEVMTRAELAEAVNEQLWRTTSRRFALDAHTVARYERGTVRWPNAAYRSAMRAVLGVNTDAELGFRPTPRGATSPSLATRPAVSRKVAKNSDTAGVDRRDFLRVGVAAIAAGATGLPDPDVYNAALGQLQALDTAQGPERPIPGVTRLLRDLTTALGTARGTDRAALLHTGARAAEFAGFLYRDLGRPNRSLFWHNRAMDWAQENQDHPMQAYVLLRKAQAAYDQRDAERMLGLARAARRFDSEVSAGLRAEVRQQEARGEAMLGLPEHGIRRKLDVARNLIADQRPAGDDRPGGTYSSTLLNLQEAVCLTGAGRPRDAVAAYRDFLDRDSSSVHDRAYFSTLMATAMALSGEPDEAARTTTAALPIAVQTGSRRTVREARTTAIALQPWSNRPAVRELDQALAKLLSQ